MEQLTDWQKKRLTELGWTESPFADWMKYGWTVDGEDPRYAHRLVAPKTHALPTNKDDAASRHDTDWIYRSVWLGKTERGANAPWRLDPPQMQSASPVALAVSWEEQISVAWSSSHRLSSYS